MVKNVLIKDFLKELRNTKARFISILLIVALGCGFFAGIQTTGGDMKRTLNNYFNENNYFDIKILSNAGLTEDDFSEIKKSNDVINAMAVHQTDLLMDFGEFTDVVRLHSYNDKDFMNQFIILEGRKPEKKGEILLNHLSGLKVGDTVSFSTGIKDKKLDEVIKNENYKVVGLVKSPLYYYTTDIKTNIGTGSVKTYGFLYHEEFKSDVYASFFIESNGGSEDVFSKEFSEEMTGFEKEIKTTSNTQELIRYNEINDELIEAEKEFSEEVGKAEIEIEDAKVKISDAEIEISSAEIEIEDGKKKLQDATNTYNTEKTNFEDSIKTAEKDLSDAKILIDNTERQLEEIDGVGEQFTGISNVQFEQMKFDFENAKAEYESGILQLEENKITGAKALEEAKIEIDNANVELLDAETELKKGSVELDEAKIELSDGEKELDDNIEEYQEKINDAREIVERIGEVSWTITTRNNIKAVTDYEIDAVRIDKIAVVFPAFFLAIAALVCLTTMTRMVEDQRIQVGTLKSLGYSNFAIGMKFIVYASLATILGIVLGLVVGFNLFPTLIFKAYSSSLFYDLPDIKVRYNWPLAIITGGVAFITIIFSCIFSIINMLKENPAELLRPLSPKPGKRILLERITFLWNKFSFNTKVTARNIFRYKKRMLMFIVGVAGCTALMLAGFGIRDAIEDIAKVQFSEIYSYDISIALDTNAKNYTEINSLISENKSIDSSNMILSEAVDITRQNGVNKSMEVDIVVFDEDKTDEFIKFNSSKSNETLAFVENGVIITEQLAQIYKLSEGDDIEITKDGVIYKVSISGIVTNYVYNYVYMPQEYYKKIFRGEAKYNRVFLVLEDEKSKDTDYQNELAKEFLKTDDVLTVMLSENMINITNSLTESLNSIVLILIICSGLLAFIVMYNLTNVNISERKREVATLKVLGFTDRETSNYILDENMILSMMGIFFGLFSGIVLTKFVITAIEVENIRFLDVIKPISFVFATLLTLAFTIIVRVVTHFQLQKIDMIDSLKSVD